MTDYTVGDTFYIAFTTRQFSTGAPFTLAGTPAVSAYENASLTQITAGITLGVDHDSVTGLNMLTIVATGGNGYESGKDYHLVITTGTVDSVSVVGEVVGRFTLGRSAAAVDLANGTDGLGAIKGDTAAILIDTGTTLQAELDGIQADTEDIQSRIPAALVNNRMDATIDGTGFEDAAVDKVWDEPRSGHATAGTYGESFVTIVSGTVSHDNTAATTTVFYSDDITEATADHYIGRIVIFTSGALANQASDITDYELAGGEGKFTVTALTEAPGDNDTFVII